MISKVGFLAINTADVEWQEDTSSGLPKGLLRKVLVDDPGRNLRVSLVKFPPGYHEPAHTHAGTHAVCVLEGKQVVGGKVLGPGDFDYGPDTDEHGPFDYPEGCIIFSVFQGDPLHRF